MGAPSVNICTWFGGAKEIRLYSKNEQTEDLKIKTSWQLTTRLREGPGFCKVTSTECSALSPGCLVMHTFREFDKETATRMSTGEESLARIPAAETTALRLCWEYAVPVPSRMVTVAGLPVLRASLTSTSKCRWEQIKGCFTWPQIAFSWDGLRPTPQQVGFSRPLTTETIWESVLKSPEQVRIVSAVRSPFRSQIKTSSRNKHMLLCIYF